MQQNYKFFQHKKCEYFPCHSEDQNCMFCYCPLFGNDFICQKLGNPETIILPEGSPIKDCSNCEFPHKKENFYLMMCGLRELIYGELADKYGGGLPKLQSLEENVKKLQDLKIEQGQLKVSLCHSAVNMSEWRRKHDELQEEIDVQASVVDYLFKLEDLSKQGGI